MHLTLHLTDRCNLCCRYCYARHGMADMSFDTAMAAINECTEQDPNPGIIFFGGEPLLMSDLIFRVIEECESRTPDRFHYKVTTNGTLVTPDFIERACAARLHVAISCDGTPFAHDRHRIAKDGKGSSDVVVVALRQILSVQPSAPVMMTVNPDTASDLPDGVRFLWGIGASYLIPSVNFHAGWDACSWNRLKKAYERLGEWYLDAFRREEKFYFASFDKRIASRIWPGRGTSCRLGLRQISVAPDGVYYPCVQFVGREEYAIGRAGKGIDERLRNSIYGCNEAKKAECAGCALLGRCNNACGCLNVSTTGTLNRVPPFYCEHERFLIPFSDRLAETLYAERNAMFIQRHYNPSFPIVSFLEDMSS